jgi:hypothetical protein
MKTIFSDMYDGMRRRLFVKKCAECRKRYYVPKHVFEKSKACSLKCIGKIAKRRQVKLVCSTCKKKFNRQRARLKNSRSGYYFCGRICKEVAQSLGGIEAIQPDHYGSGRKYRNRALKLLGKKCSKCGYDTHVKMLDVHHRDSDRSNNVIKNLVVLCVWCHALLTRGVPDHFYVFVRVRTSRTDNAARPSRASSSSTTAYAAPRAEEASAA